MTLLQRRQRDHGRAAPSSRTACSSPPGSRPATRSPSRWEQLIPAARMNVASPSCSAQSRQPGRAQPGGVQPRQPAPAVQGGGQRVRDVPPARVGAAADQAGPRGRSSGQQPALVARDDGNRPCTRAPDCHDHAAGPAADVGAPDVAQVAADQPGAGPQADQRRHPHPPRCRGLRIGQRQVAGDLRRAVRLFRAFPRQWQVRRVELRDDTPADKPQVRPQRPPRRARQARRAPGEPLGGRRVQHHPGREFQARRRRVTGELPSGPQQVLRALPAFRGRLRDHVPGERSRLRRHRRRFPPPDTGGNVSIRHTALILKCMRGTGDFGCDNENVPPTPAQQARAKAIAAEIAAASDSPCPAPSPTG